MHSPPQAHLQRHRLARVALLALGLVVLPAMVHVLAASATTNVGSATGRLKGLS
jgi:hypothetical protein